MSHRKNTIRPLSPLQNAKDAALRNSAAAAQLAVLLESRETPEVLRELLYEYVIAPLAMTYIDKCPPCSAAWVRAHFTKVLDIAVMQGAHVEYPTTLIGFGSLPRADA